MPEIYQCWFDGACWPNPNGHAAWGALAKLDGKTIWEDSGYLGTKRTSNNVAEYAGLIGVLEFLIKSKAETAIIFGDSAMVVNQITKGHWIKPNRGLYYPFWKIAYELRKKLPTDICLKWIPREQNTEADRLSRVPLISRGFYETSYTYKKRSSLPKQLSLLQ